MNISSVHCSVNCPCNGWRLRFMPTSFLTTIHWWFLYGNSKFYNFFSFAGLNSVFAMVNNHVWVFPWSTVTNKGEMCRLTVSERDGFSLVVFIHLKIPSLHVSELKGRNPILCITNPMIDIDWLIRCSNGASKRMALKCSKSTWSFKG